MKKIYKQFLCLALGAVALTACSDPNSGEGGTSVDEKEVALKAILAPYIDHTVVPTYKGMADAAVELAEACHAIQDAHTAGTLTTALIEEACGYWKESRRYWEESEAFLFGAAADYDIDPHIDSWPLDKTAMQGLLNDINSGKDWSIDNNLNFGLLGFHAVEYMLFELSADGTTSEAHSTNYSAAELVYLTTVADDLATQCVRLEAAWAGVEAISADKQTLLEEAEIELDRNYGETMKLAGQAGSLYKTCQEAVEEIVDGCITIADEVANTKMGTPVKGEDINYIESPYSLNSIVDFQGNIISIKNVYTGSVAGDACVSDYIVSVDAALDQRVRALIDESWEYIGRIEEPFAQHLTDPESTEAIDKVNELVAALEEVYAALSKY